MIEETILQSLFYQLQRLIGLSPYTVGNTMDGELAKFLKMTVFDKNQLSRHYSLTVLMFCVLAMTVLIDLKQIRPKMTMNSFKPINAYYKNSVKNIVIGFRLLQLVNLLHHLRFRETRPRRSKLKIPNF